MEDPSKMPRGKKKRYRDRRTYSDEGDDEGLQDRDSDESSEEEITIIHENRKQRAKRAANTVARRVKEEPNCRSAVFRYCLFLVVLSLGVGMVVNLYGTYGEYVTQAIFPPRTSSAALVCVEDDPVLKNDYMVSYDRFEEDNKTEGGWAFLNATQPTENLLMAWESNQLPSAATDTPHMVDIAWAAKNVLRVWVPNTTKCVSFIVWSV